MMKWQKVAKLVNNMVTTLLFTLLIIMSFVVISSKVSGEVPNFLGYQIKAVLSGSMEPGIQTGSLILIEMKEEGTQYTNGDVITFSVDENILVTHRIMEVEKKGQQFITQGDNNNGPDLQPVLAQNIVGHYTGITIPYAGYLLSLDPALLFLGLGTLFLGYGLINIWRTFRLVKNSKNA